MTRVSNPVLNDYAGWLSELKQPLQFAQQRASLSSSRELVLMGWHIGRDILERQRVKGWDVKVIDQLARDLTYGLRRRIRHAPRRQSPAPHREASKRRFSDLPLTNFG